MIETIFANNGYALLAGRVLLGGVLAPAVAGVAQRARLLTRSGAVAAIACGILCVVAGWNWAALLVLYFVSASALSRAGAGAKASRTRSIVSKGGARDACQVLANGGVYSLGAVLAAGVPSQVLAAGALGALAAASADTWATEIGVWRGQVPRSIMSGTNVRTGESGGVTTAGFAGSLAGAAFVGVVALAVGFPRGLVIALLVAGVGGSVIDSVLGATVQEKLWCDECAELTERAVHLCGRSTRRIGGIQWLDNDVVNLVSTLSGFLLGVMVYWVVGIA